MIGNTIEYLQANNLIYKIMEMIQNNPVFDDLKPVQASDIVNLSLDILRILIQIHDDSTDDKKRDIKLIEEISESSYSFVGFADISMTCQRYNNKDLTDFLSALGDIEDKTALLSEIRKEGRLNQIEKMKKGI